MTKVEVLVHAMMNAEEQLSDGYNWYIPCKVDEVEDRIRAWAERVVAEMERCSE